MALPICQVAPALQRRSRSVPISPQSRFLNKSQQPSSEPGQARGLIENVAASGLGRRLGGVTLDVDPDMTAAALSVVATNAKPETAPESISERVRRLQEEARGLAREHIRALETALAEVTRLSAEVAGGGEAYHVGVRELAARMAEETEAQRQTIEALMGRRAAH